MNNVEVTDLKPSHPPSVSLLAFIYSNDSTAHSAAHRTVFVAKDSDEMDGSVGELEMTPVAAAIARHLNIDLSLEGRAARNRRGIAVIIHGAPVSGNYMSH